MFLWPRKKALGKPVLFTDSRCSERVGRRGSPTADGQKNNRSACQLLESVVLFSLQSSNQPGGDGESKVNQASVCLCRDEKSRSMRAYKGFPIGGSEQH